MTVAGNEFLSHAIQILKQADDAKLAMQAMEGLDQGLVDVAVPSMLGSYYFPPLVMAFRHQYPNIDMNILDTGTRNIRRMLLEGEVELGVVAVRSHTGIRKRPTYPRRNGRLYGRRSPFSRERGD